MGLGPTATVGFTDEDGNWVPVSASNPLPSIGSGGGGGPADWDTLTNKPAVIAAGDTAEEARTAIGAGTSDFSPIILDANEEFPPPGTPAGTVVFRSLGYVPPAGLAVQGTATWQRGTGINSLAISTPAGVQAGEMLIAVLTLQTSGVDAQWAASGWEVLAAVPQSTTPNQRVTTVLGFPVEDAGTAPTLTTFTASATAGRALGTMFRVSGVDLENPVSFVASSPTTAGNTTTLAGATLPEDGLLLTEFHTQATSTETHELPTSVSDTGMHLVTENSTSDTPGGGSRTALSVYTKDVTAGSLAAMTCTWASTAASPSGMHLVLRGA